MGIGIQCTLAKLVEEVDQRRGPRVSPGSLLEQVMGTEVLGKGQRRTIPFNEKLVAFLLPSIPPSPVIG